MIQTNTSRTILVLLMCMSLNACIIAWNERDGSTFTSPVVIPVEMGVAAYNIAKSSTLSVEFHRSTDCTRFAPLDSHRITITRKDKNGETKSIVDKYISKELEEFKFIADNDGRYEITVFQQNQPENFKKKSFTLGDISKILVMKLPCLK